MVDVYDNYKGNMKKSRWCHYCKSEEDTTEHIIECKKLISNNNIQDLKNTNNIENWKRMIETIEYNIANRR